MEATSSLCSNEAHLWKYVTKLEKASGFGTSGNASFKCNYCGMVFTGSYSRFLGSMLIYLNYWSWY